MNADQWMATSEALLVGLDNVVHASAEERVAFMAKHLGSIVQREVQGVLKRARLEHIAMAKQHGVLTVGMLRAFCVEANMPDDAQVHVQWGSELAVVIDLQSETQDAAYDPIDNDAPLPGLHLVVQPENARMTAAVRAEAANPV